jgi:HSP20 family molecular chaperone IbpA
MEKAEASFKDGILTLLLPKTERAQQTAKEIPIKGS